MFSPERDGFVIHNSSIITAPFSKDGKTAGALAYRTYEARLCEVYPISRVFHRKISEMISEKPQEQNKEDDENE